jgi:hypothetical protein
MYTHVSKCKNDKIKKMLEIDPQEVVSESCFRLRARLFDPRVFFFFFLHFVCVKDLLIQMESLSQSFTLIFFLGNFLFLILSY